jgi:hypothetical protein
MSNLKRLLRRVVGRRTADDDDKKKFPPSSGLGRHRRRPLIERTPDAHIERLLRQGIAGRVVRLLPTERSVLQRLRREAQRRGYAVTIRPEPDVINVYIRAPSAWR